MIIRAIHDCLLGSAVVLLLACSALAQQNASEYQVKSAYLYEFARMTRWPAEILPENSKLILGVYGGDEGFLNVLRATVAGKQVNDHPIEVRRLESSRDFKSCHMVFVRNPAKDIEAAIADLGTASVLLVGDDKDFFSRGGMINFIMRERGAMYEFDSGLIARARLTFAPQGAGADASNMAQPDSRSVKLRVSPTYPDIARRMNVSGSVQLQAVVRADGTVKEVHVVGGHPLLADAALRAVMQWRFQPAGHESSERIKIDFGN